MERTALGRCAVESGSDVACVKPLYGFQDKRGSFTYRQPYPFAPSLTVPCGRCIACRLEYSRQWAVRCTHEAQMHEDNVLATLTYDDAHLPGHGSLSKADHRNFMKRLRKAVGPVRFFNAGEYGDKLKRPHYHTLLFGYRPPDLQLHRVEGGHNHYRSDLLQRVWGNGHVECTDVSFNSAAYVARYITKKITGEIAEDHYTRVDPSTGELVELTPEFATMSRRPGIGQKWIERYLDDVYPSDQVIVRGHATLPPKYYDRYLESVDEDLAARVKAARKEKAIEYEKPIARLEAKEKILKSNIALRQKRVLE